MVGYENMVHGAHLNILLLKADVPKTVKQLRGFLGAVKQLSHCIKDYSVVLSPLEKLAAGKGSLELIVWTESLHKQFDQVKNSLQSIQTFHIPKPTDSLHTFSDWSQSNGAVGGRLELHRVGDNGEIVKLHGGFFSARVSHWQTRWLPCEGEALAAKMVIHHFKPLVQNSTKTITHHTDNLPTCQAWEKSKSDAFSNSARIAAFLTEISCLDIEFKHTPGLNMGYSDYASRNANMCSEKSCQICKYLKDLVFTADNMIRSIKVEDIEKGKISMPFTQQAAWKEVQSKDKVLQMLVDLINTGQPPEKKKTCNEYTTLKLLYNLYCKGSLELSKDGLITVKNTQDSGEQTRAIVVPQSHYPGLVHSIHLKTMHCSKMQLTRLMSRYFYSVGYQRMISEVVDQCHTCLSLKPLPKELFPETTGDITGFGSHFACDVMKRHSQSILLIREKLTQYTQGSILSQETSDNILNSLVPLIADKIPEYGAIVRTDNASTFQKLTASQEDPNSWLNKFNIKIEMGETFNHNRNPIAENLMKECHKEINRAGFVDTPLDECKLALVIKNINSRIRDRGLSAKEMCYMRDQVTNKNIHHADEKLKDIQKNKRIHTHNKVPPTDVNFDPGETVMIKDHMTKTRPREKFIVLDPDVNDKHVKVQKQEKKFLARPYNVPKHQLLKIPRQAAVIAKQRIADTSHLCYVETNKPKIPTHAFDTLVDSDTEDCVVYKTVYYQEEDSISSGSTESPVSSSTANSDRERINSNVQTPSHSLDVSYSSSPLNDYALSSDEHSSNRIAIDNIIQDTRNFLQIHPKPPLSSNNCVHLRRSIRVKKEPTRYGYPDPQGERRR